MADDEAETEARAGLRERRRGADLSGPRQPAPGDGAARAPAGAAAPIGRQTDVQPKIDEQGRSYATGKRKNAIARVWIRPGNGKIEVNGRDSPVYFARPVLRMLINQPFVVPTGSASSTCGARSRAAGFPARPARCATASRRR